MFTSELSQNLADRTHLVDSMKTCSKSNCRPARS